MDGCVLFQFGANLGAYGSNYSIYKHLDWPDLYKACDLKKRCLQKISNHHSRSKKENDRFEISSNIDNTANETIIDNDLKNKTKTDNIINLLKEVETTTFTNNNNTGKSKFKYFKF